MTTNQTAVRWGIIGTGNIAHAFVRGLAEAPGARAAAVASRSADGAEAFSAELAGQRSHASYEALAEDPQIDVVYVATPHADHFASAAMCLEAGKHVLCEKPLAPTVAACESMVAAAQRHGIHLVEAFMYRNHPQWTYV
ncbi:MAG: Gfo/Idh/MocA family protein, partial [Acetobacteraceae bacterium]